MWAMTIKEIRNANSIPMSNLKNANQSYYNNLILTDTQRKLKGIPNNVNWQYNTWMI